MPDWMYSAHHSERQEKRPRWSRLTPSALGRWVSAPFCPRCLSFPVAGSCPQSSLIASGRLSCLPFTATNRPGDIWFPVRGQSGRLVRLSGPVRAEDVPCSMASLSREIVLYRERFQPGFGFEAQFEESPREMGRSVHHRARSSLSVVCLLHGVLFRNTPRNRAAHLFHEIRFPKVVLALRTGTMRQQQQRPCCPDRMDIGYGRDGT